MDKLSYMQGFVAVVEANSFSAAARHTGTSKAQLSKQVSKLEQLLGLRLLQRSTRQLRVTESGQRYYQRCRQWLDEINDAEAELQLSQSQLQGRLHISAPVSFAQTHLLSMIGDFCQQYPQLSIQLSLSDRHSDLIEEGIDIAIRIGQLRDSSLIARPIGRARMILCAAPHYLLTQAAPQQPEQLHLHRCIIDSNYLGLYDSDASRESRPGTRWIFSQAGKTLRVAIANGIRVNNAHAALELAIQGCGIAYLPSFVVRQAIEQQQLTILLPDYSSPTLGIYAVYPQRQHLPARQRIFLDAVIQHCAQLDLAD